MKLEFAQIQGAYNKIYKKTCKKTCYIKLFHYTTTEVLDKLLCSATFWASNILYLNDVEEYRKGQELINKALDTKKITDWLDYEHDIYTISFCEDGDLLSQWITYAKESGVAIELDERFLKENRNGNNFYFCIAATPHDNSQKSLEEEFSSQRYLFGTSLSPIIYADNSRQIYELILDEEDKELFEVLQEPNKTCYYKLMASYIKNDKFEAEREVRASFLNCNSILDTGIISHTKVEHNRLSNGILRPYIKAKICISDKENHSLHACLPLKSITIGPSGIQQTIFDSVVHRLKYGECKVYDYFNKDFNKFILNFVNYLCEVLNYLENEFPNLTLKPDDISTYLNENKFDKENPQSFSEKLKNVIKYIIKNNNVNINEKLLNQSKDYLKDSLAEKIEYLIKDWLVNNIGPFNTESGEGALDKLNKTFNCDKISEIKQNFYFTKEGILIRKSIIPYIF